MNYFLNWLMFGIAGLLIEVFFTGMNSLFRKDWAATSKTYLWMLPIYATGGFLVKLIHDNLVLNPNSILNAVILGFGIYFPLFYLIEASSGLLSKLALGRVLWDYGKSKWTPMGLINLKYAPYWLLLALFMHPVVVSVGRCIDFLLFNLL